MFDYVGVAKLVAAEALSSSGEILASSNLVAHTVLRVCYCYGVVREQVEPDRL